ncbi:MAG: hypothetical protein J0I41_02500 [Filimonas sp.]|nr:hypothetical protein [Filimonas sp.]
MKFEYILENAGWAVATLEEGEQKATMAVSYLHDTLEQLTNATNRLLDGTAKNTSVIFMDEPGEHEMVLTNIGNGMLDIQVKWFNDWASWGMYAEDKFTIVCSATCPLLKFAKKVKLILEHIYITYGVKGYKEKWTAHEFPYEQYMNLLRLVKRAERLY